MEEGKRREGGREDEGGGKEEGGGGGEKREVGDGSRGWNVVEVIRERRRKNKTRVEGGGRKTQ